MRPSFEKAFLSMEGPDYEALFGPLYKGDPHKENRSRKQKSVEMSRSVILESSNKKRPLNSERPPMTGTEC